MLLPLRLPVLELGSCFAPHPLIHQLGIYWWKITLSSSAVSTRLISLSSPFFFLSLFFPPLPQQDELDAYPSFDV